MNPVLTHTVLESAAYFLGFRYFLRERRRLALPALADTDRSLWIGVAAILGAALGAKLGFWIEDPRAAFADFPDWHHFLQGKTIVGALLGGLAAVELAKWRLGVRASSGDAFAFPLMLGIAVGRVGCFLAGLADHTYGNPTALPWGVDFGDGVPRHPTQLYEIAFLGLWALVVARRPAALRGEGDAFRLFLVGYLGFRLLVEAIKPLLYAYFGALSGIQLLCLGGLCYYWRDIGRWGGTAWGRS